MVTKPAPWKLVPIAARPGKASAVQAKISAGEADSNFWASALISVLDGSSETDIRALISNCLPRIRKYYFQALEKSLRYLHQMLSGNSKFLHDLSAWTTQPKAINPHGLSIQADILVPKRSSTSFDRHSFPTRRRQNFISIRLILTIEFIQTRRRNNSDPATQLLGSS